MIGRHCGLDTNISAFSLPAWTDDETDTLIERLGRISRTASTIIAGVGSPSGGTGE